MSRSIRDFPVATIYGDETSLPDYRGRTLLVAIAPLDAYLTRDGR
jgi:hypothetical protein